MVSKKKAWCIIVVLFLLPIFIGAVTQISLTTQVSGILPTANGGTGVNGSATFPSSGTVMTTTTGVTASQLPNPTASTLGGIQSKDCTGSGHIVTISTAGVVSCSADAAGPNFADNETPTGSINGSNTSFTLAHTPSPALSLNCFSNGVQQRAGGADFTLATATITYGVAPPTGTTLVCSYRY